MNFFLRPDQQFKAMQWRGIMRDDIADFIPKKYKVTFVNGELYLQSPTLTITYHKNDWIMKNQHDNCYVCNNELFKTIFEKWDEYEN